MPCLHLRRGRCFIYKIGEWNTRDCEFHTVNEFHLKVSSCSWMITPYSLGLILHVTERPNREIFVVLLKVKTTYWFSRLCTILPKMLDSLLKTYPLRCEPVHVRTPKFQKTISQLYGIFLELLILLVWLSRIGSLKLLTLWFKITVWLVIQSYLKKILR